MKRLLEATARRTGIHPAQLFKDAYDYNEIRVMPELLMFEYEDCLVKNNVPKFVVDYLLSFWYNGLSTKGQ